MKIDRPLWATGMMLSPQIFQQQARWEAYTNECLASLALVHPWGVLAASFDSDALRLGKLKAQHLRVRLQDGTLIDTDSADRLPPALELALAVPEGRQTVTLLLALPLEHANGGNCLRGEAKADRPTRYRQDWREVQDVYDDDSQSIAVEEYALTLRVDGDENGNYLTCPVGQLVRDTQGSWSLDPLFVPPLLHVSAHLALMNQLDSLLTQLRAKRTRLMGMRRESNQRMADFAVADVSLFWLLNALNTYEPVLADVLAHPARPPELVYRELVKLAGALLTFSLDHELSAIPAYDHQHLGTVLPPLLSLIGTLLEASLPSRVMALPLENVNAHLWTVSLNDPRLREDADFYLSVRSSLPAHQIQTQFPLLCKAGAPDDVNQLINIALNGIPLLPLSHVPAAIPLRLENQYFALDLKHAKGQAMLAAGACSFYVPGTLADVQLELFAVLRS